MGESGPRKDPPMKVLLVDDGGDEDDAMLEALEDGGFKVTTVEADGVARMLKRRDFDVVMGNCLSEDASGFDAVSRIREGKGSSRDIPIVGMVPAKKRMDEALSARVMAWMPPLPCLAVVRCQAAAWVMC